MTKNTLLNIAIYVSRLLKILLIIAALGLTSLFVYAQIDKETFVDRELILSECPSPVSISFIEYKDWYTTDGGKRDLQPYTFGKLKTVSLYLNYFKLLIVIALVFLIIRAFERIMLSVKALSTFSNNNVQLFRKIGVYVVFISILISYTVLRFENGIQSKAYMSIFPVIFALLAFIMAEIFKEGKSLRDENDLTI